VEYLPTQNSWGAAFTSFTFRVSDSSGTFSAPATITIDVAAVNDAPTLELTSPPAGTFFATVYKNDVNVVASVDFTLADNDEPTSPAATYRCDVDPGSMLLGVRLPDGEPAYLNGDIQTDAGGMFSGSFNAYDFYFSGSFADVSTILHNFEVRGGALGPGEAVITIECSDGGSSPATFELLVRILETEQTAFGGTASSLSNSTGPWYEAPAQVLALYAVVVAIPLCCVLYCVSACCRKCRKKETDSFRNLDLERSPSKVVKLGMVELDDRI